MRWVYAISIVFMSIRIGTILLLHDGSFVTWAQALFVVLIGTSFATDVVSGRRKS